MLSEPVVAVVGLGGERLQAALAPGSVLCPPGCAEGLVLEEPLWARGVRLRRGPCPYTGDDGLAERISALTGLALRRAGPEEVLGEGGLALAPRGLDTEPLGERCGVLEAMLPSHPVGAAAEAHRAETCLDVYEPVRGSRWWGGVPLARLHRGPVIAYRFGVIRGDRPEALLYTGVPRGEPPMAMLIGAIYACGERLE